MSLMRDTNRERGQERATYTVAEAAELLGCSPAHIYNRIAAHDIPVVAGLGRLKRIPRAAIDRMLAGQPAEVA